MSNCAKIIKAKLLKFSFRMLMLLVYRALPISQSMVVFRDVHLKCKIDICVHRINVVEKFTGVCFGFEQEEGIVQVFFCTGCKAISLKFVHKGICNEPTKSHSLFCL